LAFKFLRINKRQLAFVLTAVCRQLLFALQCPVAHVIPGRAAAAPMLAGVALHRCPAHTTAQVAPQPIVLVKRAALYPATVGSHALLHRLPLGLLYNGRYRQFNMLAGRLFTYPLGHLKFGFIDHPGAGGHGIAQYAPYRAGRPRCAPGRGTLRIKRIGYICKAAACQVKLHHALISLGLRRYRYQHHGVVFFRPLVAVWRMSNFCFASPPLDGTVGVRAQLYAFPVKRCNGPQHA